MSGADDLAVLGVFWFLRRESEIERQSSSREIVSRPALFPPWGVTRREKKPLSGEEPRPLNP